MCIKYWEIQNNIYLRLNTTVQMFGLARFFSPFCLGFIYLVKNTKKQEYCDILLEFSKKIRYILHYNLSLMADLNFQQI